MLSESFTLTLEPLTSSTVPSRDGSGLPGWLCIVSAPATKLFKKKAKVVEIAQTAARLLLFGTIPNLGLFFNEPRGVLISANGSGSISAYSCSYDRSVPSKNGEIALLYCIVHSSRVLSKPGIHQRKALGIAIPSQPIKQDFIQMIVKKRISTHHQSRSILPMKEGS